MNVFCEWVQCEFLIYTCLRAPGDLMSIYELLPHNIMAYGAI